MNIKISGQHMDVTEGLRNTVTEKLMKLERHIHHITSAHVVLHTDKIKQHADATINHRGGQLRASASADDIFIAIQELAEKLDKQAIKFKEKNLDHGRGQEDEE